MLVVARIGQGLFAGPIMPLSQTLLLRIFGREKSGNAMGIWSVTTVIAPVLQPILGGVISDNYHWSWIFFIDMPVAAFIIYGVISRLGAGVGASSKFPPMRDHAATEIMLRDSGMAWTALRNGFYAASGIAMTGDAATSGVIRTTQDGPVAWTAHADLAEAAAVILTDEGRFDGPTPPLTGAEALTFDDVAALLTELTGRPVKHEVLTDEAMRSAMVARGAPAAAVPTLVGLFAASRDGEFATVDPTLSELLGRRPISMCDLLAESVGRP